MAEPYLPFFVGSAPFPDSLREDIISVCIPFYT
ncbi:hypothetical protein LSS_23185 [Leptospira santarosai serovar Shermani str. LT 821]|uniref:Uncharacterized protein n=1 Tax=Leptospira santarosai serovar Shermani str. LT 821 TaxID=758847 RepID=A0A097ET20_9LEPT|nr:hypothetical protein LSS_23185 [Leptospira santarosai serovar Shermani str. LT 821]